MGVSPQAVHRSTGVSSARRCRLSTWVSKGHTHCLNSPGLVLGPHIQGDTGKLRCPEENDQNGQTARSYNEKSLKKLVVLSTEQNTQKAVSHHEGLSRKPDCVTDANESGR